MVWCQNQKKISSMGIKGILIVLVLILCFPENSFVFAQDSSSAVSVVDSQGAISSSSGVYKITVSGTVHNSLPFDIENVNVLVYFPEQFTEGITTTTVDEVKAGKTATFLLQKESTILLNEYRIGVSSYDIKSGDVKTLLPLYFGNDDIVLKYSIASTFSRMDSGSLPDLIECINVEKRLTEDKDFATTDLLCLDGLAVTADITAVEPLLKLADWYEVSETKSQMELVINNVLTNPDEPLTQLSVFKDKDLQNLTDIEIEILQKIGTPSVPILLDAVLSNEADARGLIASAVLDTLKKTQPSEVLLERDTKVLTELIRIYSLHKVPESVYPMLTINPEYISSEIVDDAILRMKETAVPGLVESLYGPSGDIALRSENLLRMLGSDSTLALQEMILAEGRTLPSQADNPNELVDIIIEITREKITDQIDPIFQKAWEYYLSGDCLDALSQVTEINKIRDDVFEHSAQISQIYLCAAKESVKDGDSLVAMSYLERAYFLNPEDVLIREEFISVGSIVTKIHVTNGDTEKAEELVRQIVEIAPNDREARRLLWSILVTQNIYLLLFSLIGLSILWIRTRDSL
jgi:tetratricopeptide (TPR) repeat protein